MHNQWEYAWFWRTQILLILVSQRHIHLTEYYREHAQMRQEFHSRAEHPVLLSY